MIFSKKISVKFKNTNDPNCSMGRLITFYRNNEVCAHLSLTWECKLWFAFYRRVNKEWSDFYLYQNFNEILFSDTNEFHFIYDDEQDFVILKQNNIIEKIELEGNKVPLNDVRFLENFNDHKMDIKNNVFEICESDLVVDHKDKEIFFDMILCGYKAFNWLELCLTSLLETYIAFPASSAKLKKFIYCDNNYGVDLQISKRIIEDFGRKAKDYFEVIYFENLDKTYCHNRISGVNQAVKLSNSEIITMIDSDVIFLYPEWLDYYKNFNSLGVDCVGEILKSMNTDRIRHASFLLPRLNPCFLSFRASYLKEAIRKDENILGDYTLSVQYYNLNINMVGFHFSHIYLDMISNNMNIFVFGIPSLIYHVQSGSFEEFHNECMKKEKIKKFIAHLEYIKANDTTYPFYDIFKDNEILNVH